MALLTKEQKLKKLQLLRQKAIIQSRTSFWIFCKTIAPDFYKEDRTYLKDLCNTLQNIYEQKLINPKTNKPYKNLALSIPPRHGKSRTVGLFTAWCVGVNKQNKIMTASYNEDIGTTFSRNCRDLMFTPKNDEFETVFSEIFADIAIKKGNSAVNNWTVEGGYNTYYGGGFGSSFTGRGCSMLIIDDPIKNAMEAMNDTTLEQIYTQYTDTLMSRVEGDGITIIIQTRWSKKDLIGRVLGGDDGDSWYELSLKAFDGEKMLCESILSKEKYDSLSKSMSDLIFLANYNQTCIDAKGALYTNLKHYEDIPRDNEGNQLFEGIYAFIDTADKGNDYLALIVAGAYQKELYILDILYTQEPMQVTEKLVAKMLYENDVTIAKFESNNGGGLFANRIRDILVRDYDTNKIVIKEEVQTRNKQTRILVTAPWIQEHVFFPVNAKHRWKEAWEHLITFSKSGKNAHDDIEDCLTALAENFGQGIKKEKKLRSIRLPGI